VKLMMLSCPDRFHLKIYIYFHENKVVCTYFVDILQALLRYKSISDVGSNAELATNKYHK